MNTRSSTYTSVYTSSPIPPVRYGLFRTRATKQVGVVAPNYGLERVSYILPVEGYEFVTLKRLPLNSLLEKPLDRLGTSGTFWYYTPVVVAPSVPLIHTFNMLPMNGDRFVVSYEAELPRYLGPRREWQHQIGHKILASKRCAAILSMTDIGCRLTQKRMQAEGLSEVADKISVFSGAVLPSSAPLESREPKDPAKPLKLLFLGGDGFRKGLVPVIEAVEELRHGGVEVELTVISTITQATYSVFAKADLFPSPEMLRQKLIEQPWVDYHPKLSNSQIRQLMGSHDLFVMPSFDDIHPWVLVEAGMEGLGTIATNIFAFPEFIEDGKTGRLIEIDLNEQRRWVGLFLEDACDQKQALLEANQAIKQGLIKTIEQVDKNRNLVREWGQAAYEKTCRKYHPVRAAEALKEIYDKALNSN